MPWRNYHEEYSSFNPFFIRAILPTHAPRQEYDGLSPALAIRSSPRSSRGCDRLPERRWGRSRVGPGRISRTGAGQAPWPLRGQACIEQVALVGFVAKQMRGLGIDHTGGESWLHKGDFRRLSRRSGDGERKTSTVCHGPAPRLLGSLGRSHPAPLFWLPRGCHE
jgi:hypothetical protein